MTLRRSLAVILCLLLLSLQSQALVHPLSHLGQAKPQETGIASSTVDAPCLQCALLAGGATAVVAVATTFHAGNVADVVVVHFHSQRTAGAPAWFDSRAPPALLA